MAIKGLSPKYEIGLLDRGFTRVIGIDEVGRGAWAGPLVLGAFSYTIDHKKLQSINDSKVLTRKKRELLVDRLKPATKIIEISVNEIDNRGLGAAMNNTLNSIIEELTDGSTYFLIDGRFPKVKQSNCEIIVDGDAKIYSIAAASIVAKVHRDAIMREYSKLYPKYGFGSNVGYGTRYHRNALKEHGVLEIHRKSYAPIQKFSQITLIN